MTNHVKSEEVTIENSPTELMLADFLTKPLHDTVCHKSRELIMGRKNIDSLREFGFYLKQRSMLKVCFGIGPDSFSHSKQRSMLNILFWHWTE